MKKIKNLKDICAVSFNTIDDNYVGIMFKNDEVKVYIFRQDMKYQKKIVSAEEAL